MDIPNLANQNSPSDFLEEKRFSPLVTGIVVFLAILVGLILSRLVPNKIDSRNLSINSTSKSAPLSTDSISSSEQLQVGKIYGNLEKNFKDTAVGIIEKGSINGEGTHILNREGGVSQRASLTSSAVDLDLFIGKKVEIKGETNASTKTAWLLDVGSLKILE